MSVNVYLVKKVYVRPSLTAFNWKWGLTTKDHFQKRNSAYSECYRWEGLPDHKTARRFEGCMAAIVDDIVGIERKGCRQRRGDKAFRRGRCSPEECGADVSIFLVMAAWDVALGRALAPIEKLEWGDEVGYERLVARRREEALELASLYEGVTASPEPMWA